jgi:hypothetical protein
MLYDSQSIFTIPLLLFNFSLLTGVVKYGGDLKNKILSIAGIMQLWHE